MHLNTYHTINRFFNRLFDWFDGLRGVRVGDWYATGWSYEFKDFDGVYVIESVRDGWVRMRYCGIRDNYRSTRPQTLKIATLELCYRRVNSLKKEGEK